MFLLWLRHLSQGGTRTPASVPPPTKGRSSSTNTPISLPSSFILLSFVWVYIFFSAGQVLLSALSWCWACTFVSEGIFLMYTWREMYYTSTYSSIILFSNQLVFNKRKPHCLEIEKDLQNDSGKEYLYGISRKYFYVQFQSKLLKYLYNCNN